MSDNDALVEKISEVVGRLYLTTSDGGVHSTEDIARAVLPLVGSEVTCLKFDRDRLWGDVKELAEQVADTRRRAEAAESALRQILELHAEGEDGRCGECADKFCATPWDGSCEVAAIVARCRRLRARDQDHDWAALREALANERDEKERAQDYAQDLKEQLAHWKAGALVESVTPTSGEECGCDGCTVCPGHQTGCVCDVDFGDLHDNKLGGPYLAFCTRCGRGMNPGDVMCCPKEVQS